MALRGYKTPDDPLPKLTRSNGDGSGAYTGKYSAKTMGAPSRYDVIGQRLNRSDSADPFLKTATSGSFESSGVVGNADIPDVGGIDAVNFKGR